MNHDSDELLDVDSNITSLPSSSAAASAATSAATSVAASAATPAAASAATSSAASSMNEDDAPRNEALFQFLSDNLSPENHEDNQVLSSFLSVDAQRQNLLKSLMESLKEKTSFCCSLGVAGMPLPIAETLFQECSKRLEPSSGRVALVTVGLGRDLIGEHDLRRLTDKIKSTLSWYDDGNFRKYRCPSFPIVQSSGMGKTRLMKACRDCINKSQRAVLLLCLFDEDSEPEDWKDHYNGVLRVPTEDDETARGRLTSQLASFCDDTKAVLVFFFDEGQKLLKHHDGFAYSSIQWWLRRSTMTRLVGVFAGTNSSLGKLYLGRRPGSGFSRDARVSYLNYWEEDTTQEPIQLYDPFLDLTTISCYMNDPRSTTFSTDFENCSFYGRPLFPVMLTEVNTKTNVPVLVVASSDLGREGAWNVVRNNVLCAILKRMMINESQATWDTNSNAVMSILGTRVQLGIATSADFIDKVTSQGYANLVEHRIVPDEPNRTSWVSSQLAFMPDPVCAALAMGMMRPCWKLVGKGEGYTGRQPSFWSRKAAEFFSKRLFLPEKGDAGEVMAALQMLFVGDELREMQEGSMRSFEVSFVEWLQRFDGETETRSDDDETLLTPRESKTQAIKKMRAQSGGTIDPPFRVSARCSINFIQVCRNYFRSHCWFTENGLKYMYRAAIASYAFVNCPAFDIVAPIRREHDDGKGESFNPLFVSVKSWDKIHKSDMVNALGAMEKYLDDYRPEGTARAFCLLVVVGSHRASKPPRPCGDFPREDAFATVIVSNKDEFGVSEAVKTIANTTVLAEMRASHYMAGFESRESAFRSKLQKKDADFGNFLFDDKIKLSGKW